MNLVDLSYFVIHRCSPSYAFSFQTPIAKYKVLSDEPMHLICAAAIEIKENVCHQLEEQYRYRILHKPQRNY